MPNDHDHPFDALDRSHRHPTGPVVAVVVVVVVAMPHAPLATRPLGQARLHTLLHGVYPPSGPRKHLAQYTLPPMPPLCAPRCRTKRSPLDHRRQARSPAPCQHQRLAEVQVVVPEGVQVVCRLTLRQNMLPQQHHHKRLRNSV